VDYEREKKNREFMRTTGNDLTHGNPHLEKQVEISNFNEIKARVIHACK